MSALCDGQVSVRQRVEIGNRFFGQTEGRISHFKGITIARGGRIGAGAVLLAGLAVGEDALVAVGSIVTRDGPVHSIVMGAPARVVRDVSG